MGLLLFRSLLCFRYVYKYRNKINITIKFKPVLTDSIMIYCDPLDKNSIFYFLHAVKPSDKLLLAKFVQNYTNQQTLQFKKIITSKSSYAFLLCFRHVFK